MTLRDAMRKWFEMTAARYLMRDDLDCTKHKELTDFMDEHMVIPRKEYDMYRSILKLKQEQEGEFDGTDAIEGSDRKDS